MWSLRYINSAGGLLVAIALLLGGCAGNAPKPQVATPTAAVLPQQQADYDRAVQAMAQKNWGQASTLLQTLVAQNPRLVTPYVNLGIIAEQQHDPQQAQQWYDKALAIDATQPDALNQLAIMAREKGDFRKALSLYQRALEDHDNLALLHYNIAVLYDVYLGDYAHALQHYQRFQELSAKQDDKVAMWITDLKRRVQ